jgi:hypothetical protein
MYHHKTLSVLLGCDAMQYSGQDSAPSITRVQFNPEDGRMSFFQKAKNPQLMYSNITPTCPFSCSDIKCPSAYTLLSLDYLNRS